MLENFSKEPIEIRVPTLTLETLEAFNRATGAALRGVHPVFPTCLRKTEFLWLDRVEVDFRKLLHLDQEYEYLEDLRAGDDLVITTKILEVKQRRSLRFFTLQTEITSGSRVKIRGTTAFLIREGGQE